MSEILAFFKSEDLKSYETTEFAERIKKLRKRNHITQAQISELAELSRSTYGTYERSEALPDAKTVYIMAKAFDVSADYILGLTIEEQPLDVGLVDFSSEIIRDFKKITEMETIRNTFEAFIHQKDFVQFMTYMYTYLILNSKISRAAKELLRKNYMDDKVYYTGITPMEKEDPDDKMSVFDFPECRVEIAEIYRIKMHELLDEFIKNMSKDKFFSGEMEKKIYKATYTKHGMSIEEFFKNLYGDDEGKI